MTKPCTSSHVEAKVARKLSLPSFQVCVWICTCVCVCGLHTIGQQPEAFPSRSHSTTPALHTWRENEGEKRECVPRSVGARSSFSDRQPFFRPLVLLMPSSLFTPLQSHFDAFVTALRLFFFCRLYIINVLSPRPWQSMWEGPIERESCLSTKIKRTTFLKASGVQLCYTDFVCLWDFSAGYDSMFPDLGLRSLLMTIQSVWLRKLWHDTQ